MTDSSPTPLCGLCDDYLADGLDRGAREGFERHLSECDACRAIVAEDRRLSELLKAAAASELVPPGIGEWGRSGERLREAGRPATFAPVGRPAGKPRATRRGMSVVGLVAAAMAVAASAWLLPRPDVHRALPVADGVHAGNPPAGETAAATQSRSAPPRVEAQIGAFEDYITVPIESHDPTVSIFWAYPTKPVTQDQPGPRLPKLLNSVSPRTTRRAT